MSNHHVMYSESLENNDENENIYFKYIDEPRIYRNNLDFHKQIPRLRVIRSFFKQIFLPQGFPESVHPDYIPYQIWDTVQAFASTIMGILTTQSIMQGVGVGKSTATPLAAAITWILKDGTGMLGRILFVWWKGSELDARCKRWRICADIMNDISMGIELTVPYFSSCSTFVLCIATAMKSIVGVAGGATRVAMTQHLALQNNLADVSAKDGSQETFVNLIASLFGIFILSYLSQQSSVHLYILLVIIHIYANYSAVKSLRLESLNEDRTALIINDYFANNGLIADPKKINKLESLVLFHNTTKNICGFNIQLGASFVNVISEEESIDSDDIVQFVTHFQHRKFFPVVNMKRRTIYMYLSKYAERDNIFEAFFHGLLYGLFITMKLNSTTLQHESVLMLNNLANNVENSKSVLENLENITQMRVPADSIFALDKILSKEYSIFVQRLEKSAWISRNNLLSVESWRGTWEPLDHRNYDLSF